MSKRRRSSVAEVADVSLLPPRAAKRVRFNKPDFLSQLSDELIIRTLSFLGTADLVTCQRLSQRFSVLATDSQLWKALYYARFVLPRAARIPGVASGSLIFSSKVSKWLDDDHLVRSGIRTNWKAQYKLRFNWSRGSSRVSELELNGLQPPIKPLIRMHKDMAITVDEAHGLRVWKIDGPNRLVAQCALDDEGRNGRCTPCSVAIDDKDDADETLSVAVGFQDGGFGIYEFTSASTELRSLFRHPASSNGALGAVALSVPYFATVSESQSLSLYSLPEAQGARGAKPQPPQLICSLRSQTARMPLTISLRVLLSGVVASIAYLVPRYLTGWGLALQELRFSPVGQLTDSRMTSSALRGYETHLDISSDDVDGSDDAPFAVLGNVRDSLPTSLSYFHPYLLLARPDNTLVAYLVHSSATELRIGQPQRLFGHTSSVSDVQVGERGRAISASRAGDEIRVWELETMLRRRPGRPRFDSIAVRPSPARAAPEQLRSGRPHSVRNHRVVGFDQEKVVMMREDVARTLVVYDFS